jgi:hypothetical protein
MMDHIRDGTTMMLGMRFAHMIGHVVLILVIAALVKYVFFQ